MQKQVAVPSELNISTVRFWAD